MLSHPLITHSDGNDARASIPHEGFSTSVEDWFTAEDFGSGTVDLGRIGINENIKNLGLTYKLVIEKNRTVTTRELLVYLILAFSSGLGWLKFSTLPLAETSLHILIL
jgi:hypothetical protein